MQTQPPSPISAPSISAPSMRAWGVFGLLSLVWGASFLFIKIALAELGPVTLVALRVGFGLVFLLLVLRWQRLSLPRDPRLWGLLTVAGLFNTAVPFVLIAWSEQTIDSGLASILNGTTPLFGLLIAHLVLHDERITGAKLIGVIISFIGLIIIVGRNPGSGFFSNVLGELAVIAASLSYASTSVFVRRFLRDQPTTVLAIGQLASAEVFLLAGILLAEWPLRLPTLPITWLSVLWLGILGSGFAYLLYFYLIKEMGASRTTTVTYAIPVVGVLLGVLVLHEALEGRVLAGAGLVIGGVVMGNWRRAGR
ncbi:MAG: DMT family transporter [Anaerolineae bacterium]|nr:DMT family transporter [Anaerolineae bacterium]